MCSKIVSNIVIYVNCNNSVGLPVHRVITDRENFGQPGVISDMKLKLQVLCFCTTYVIVDYY